MVEYARWSLWAVPKIYCLWWKCRPYEASYGKKLFKERLKIRLLFHRLGNVGQECSDDLENDVSVVQWRHGDGAARRRAQRPPLCTRGSNSPQSVSTLKVESWFTMAPASCNAHNSRPHRMISRQTRASPRLPVSPPPFTVQPDTANKFCSMVGYDTNLKKSSALKSERNSLRERISIACFLRNNGPLLWIKAPSNEYPKNLLEERYC